MMANFAHKITLILIGLALAASLGACGKRAAELRAPTQDAEDQFPFMYPDPSTDPKPVP